MSLLVTAATQRNYGELLLRCVTYMMVIIGSLDATYHTYPGLQARKFAVLDRSMYGFLAGDFLGVV